MKFLNVNSSYLTNLNFGNNNINNNITNNLNKRFTSLNKPAYNGNYKNTTKFGTISTGSTNHNSTTYRKSSSMTSLKHVHY